MGLDITAYSNLLHLGRHTLELWCEDESHISAYAYDAFGHSFRGIPVLGQPQINGDRFIVGGCYERTPETEEHSFRAGSYGGYGQWREDLQRRFNPSRDPDGPFYELIWFADNEGSIGPSAAECLLADFRAHAAAYAAAETSRWDREKYADWTNAFELAAQSGLVHFH